MSGEDLVCWWLLREPAVRIVFAELFLISWWSYCVRFEICSLRGSIFALTLSSINSREIRCPADVRLRQKWRCNRPLVNGLDAVLSPSIETAESIPHAVLWGGDKTFYLFIDRFLRQNTKSRDFFLSVFWRVTILLSSTLPFSLISKSVRFIAFTVP